MGALDCSLWQPWWTRKLVRAALDVDGKPCLAYHPWIPKDLLLKAYSGLPDLGSLKKETDPEPLIQNEFLRNYDFYE